MPLLMCLQQQLQAKALLLQQFPALLLQQLLVAGTLLGVGQQLPL
jgi:hypothetical protein